MSESFVTKKGKTMKCYSLTEITSPWAWEESLDRTYDAQIRKYTPVQIRFQQAMAGIDDEVRLNIIIVSHSGVVLRRAQKDFAIATMLPRNRLAAHACFIVYAAMTQAHEHYGGYCKALSIAEIVKDAHSKYNFLEQEFAEGARDMEVYDSIRDVEVIKDGKALALEDGG
jgi:hypothetical protein